MSRKSGRRFSDKDMRHSRSDCVSRLGRRVPGTRGTGLRSEGRARPSVPLPKAPENWDSAAKLGPFVKRRVVTGGYAICGNEPNGEGEVRGPCENEPNGRQEAAS